MSLDSASYIERASDRELFEGLFAGKYCYVLNSRQMGKSSLSVRAIHNLELAGVRTALVDLTRIGGKNVTAAQWYAGLTDAVGSGLDLQSEMLDYYRQNSLLSPMQRFFGAIEKVALARISAPISIFIDEIDSTKNLSFQADEFFAGIRECFNRRVQDPVFERLNFCLIGVAVPSDLISNPSTTPFNIGERIQLNDFSLEEMKSLGPALGPKGVELLERVHYWTGGQPFLTQSLCEAISGDQKVQTADGVDELVRSRLLERRARTTNINLADVGDRALSSGSAEKDPERFRAELLTAYEKAWRGGFVPDDESNRIAVILKLSGLVRSDGRRLEVRNRIYREVFDRKWVEANIPERELLRERQAFRRGILRAASASAAVIVVVCAFGLIAWKSKNEADTSRRALAYELYVADMNNMRVLEETGDIARMGEILDRTRNSPYRGFEWSFWLGRIHDSKEEYTLDYAAPGKREEGFVSQDGKQICVYDSLSGTAAVIDRQTKKAVATAQVGHRARIVATSAGFITIVGVQTRVEAKNIVTGKVLSSVDFGKPIINNPVTKTRSDFACALLRDYADGVPREIVAWDLVTGRTKFDFRSFNVLPQGPLAMSKSGNRILFSQHRDFAPDPSLPIWVVLDTGTSSVVDSIEMPARSSLLDFSDSGQVVVYRDPRQNTVCRDVNLHRIVFSRALGGGDISTSTIVSGDDQVIAETFGNGLASGIALKDGQSTLLGMNVWNLSSTDSPKKFLADSTSVRFLDRSSTASVEPVGHGIRVSRNDRGEICFFRQGNSGIQLFSDPSLRPSTIFNAPPRLRGSYTFNGRWRLSTDESGKVGLFSDVEGTMSPLRISPVPVNYSCGDNEDSLVVLEKGGRRIDGLSVRTETNRWSFEVPGEQVTGLWVSPKGELALALGGDVDLMAIDTRSGKLLATLGGHNVRIATLAFTRDKTKFFTCGHDGRVILWDIATLKMIKEFRGNVAQRISYADLSPDGTRVATCNVAGSWQLWDAGTGRQLADIRVSSLPLRSVLFTADGKSVLTAGDDLEVRRWGSTSQDPSVRIRVESDILKGIKQ